MFEKSFLITQRLKYQQFFKVQKTDFFNFSKFEKSVQKVHQNIQFFMSEKAVQTVIFFKSGKSIFPSPKSQLKVNFFNFFHVQKVISDNYTLKYQQFFLKFEKWVKKFNFFFQVQKSQFKGQFFLVTIVRPKNKFFQIRKVSQKVDFFNFFVPKKSFLVIKKFNFFKLKRSVKNSIFSSNPKSQFKRSIF